MEAIQGTVGRILFHNVGSGYSVFNLKMKDHSVTCKGVVSPISEGDFLIVDGNYVKDPTYGLQFQADTIRKDLPADESDLVAYLSTAVRGVGDVTAKRIVKAFGMDTFRVLEEEPERVAKLKGVSKNKALDFSKQLKKRRENREEEMFFVQLGIHGRMIEKIKTFYEEKGGYRDAIMKNPYRLVDDIDGIGFLKADDIALRMNIPRDSIFRLTQGILYDLNLQENGNGHVYYPKSLLIPEAASLLKVSEDKIEDAFTYLESTGKIIVVKSEEEDLVYRRVSYYRELSVAENLFKVLRLAKSVDSDPKTIAKEIHELEEPGRELDDTQFFAVVQAIMNGVIAITGGPGTGKTTTLKVLIQYLVKKGYQLALAAPTGRAAKRMEESTGMPAKTIHRLIGFPEGLEIQADAVIIDEASMIDLPLMSAFLKQIQPGTKLIIVGDVDQIPSVGPGTILRDIIESGAIPCVKLTNIHRQAAESNIITNAYRINNGLPLNLNDSKEDFFCMKREDTQEIIRVMKALIVQAIPRHFHIKPTEVQVLAPMRNGVLGVNNLNAVLQDLLNPRDESKTELVIGGTLFREGDKVMNIKNNYHMEWTQVFGDEEITGLGVFNGDSGILTEINTLDQYAKVLFDDGREAVYDFDQIKKLMLAYAITIHKSQGSEYPAVIMPLAKGGPPMLFNRNILYTGVTRAKYCVAFVGNPKVIQQMKNNTKSQVRYTRLKECLQEIQKTEPGSVL